MTEMKNDGGPAFPTKGGLVFYFPENAKEQLKEVEKKVTAENEGMTLRDWFAGQALAGMASIALDDGDMIMGWADMSRAAYNAADAMLSARQKQGGGE